jgi:hypothetical protein
MTQPDPADPNANDSQYRGPAGHDSDSEGEREDGLDYRQRQWFPDWWSEAGYPIPWDVEQTPPAAASPDGVTEPVSTDRSLEGDSDRFPGYRVREPDGTWRGGRGSDPVEDSSGYRVREPDGTWRGGRRSDPVEDSSGYRVREPDGTWRGGRRLGPGELPPGYEQEENTPEQPTVEQRREAALAAALRRRDAESTLDDQSQGYSR